MSKTERKELKRQEKQAERQRTTRRRTLRWFLKTGAIVLAAFGAMGGITWYIATRPPIVEADVVSRLGLHRHVELRITIKGMQQDIPENLGIGVQHNPIHTHDRDGVIHLEFQGFVTMDDLRLREFFKVWGKRFNRNCIFEYCNGPDGNVTMLVNGVENREFESYVMKDKDNIEIRYR
ncbi:MAG: hypothetical protein ACRD88_02270 [Terriglobia bacterium]